MTTARDRTLPLFEDIDVPRVDTRPTIATLRRRLNKVALGFFRDTHSAEDVLIAARHLDERLRET